jgi:phage-related baseplate assembly protein
MALQETLQKLEIEAIAIWEFLTNKPSLPSQLERLYLKPLIYLVGSFLNARAAIVATAKPGIINGSSQAYRDRVLAISSDLVDASITNPSGNNITIHLLAKAGQPSTTLLNLVLTTMQADPNRLICDTIAVQPASAVNYTINAALTLDFTANEQIILAAATVALNEYTANKQSTLGGDIIRTDLIDILRDFVEIKDVILTAPATNTVIPPQSYGVATSTVLTVSGRS